MHITKTPCCSKICVNNSQDPFVTNSPRNKESYWWRDKFRFAESVAPCNSIILINKKGSALPSTTRAPLYYIAYLLRRQCAAQHQILGAGAATPPPRGGRMENITQTFPVRRELFRISSTQTEDTQVWPNIESIHLQPLRTALTLPLNFPRCCPSALASQPLRASMRA